MELFQVTYLEYDDGGKLLSPRYYAMKTGECITRSTPLRQAGIKGRQAIQVGDDDSYLVKLDMDSRQWSLVDSIEHTVPFRELRGKSVTHDRRGLNLAAAVSTCRRPPHRPTRR